jgi:hypothetical protein
MIHKNYLILTDAERAFVDAMFTHAYPEAREYGFRLAGDDRAERAVEAMATWVVESRSKVPVEALSYADRRREAEQQSEVDGDDITCIITGAEGENPDDCTTHDHEPPRRSK